MHCHQPNTSWLSWPGGSQRRQRRACPPRGQGRAGQQPHGPLRWASQAAPTKTLRLGTQRQEPSWGAPRMPAGRRQQNEPPAASQVPAAPRPATHPWWHLHFAAGIAILHHNNVVRLEERPPARQPVRQGVSDGRRRAAPAGPSLLPPPALACSLTTSPRTLNSGSWESQCPACSIAIPRDRTLALPHPPFCYGTLVAHWSASGALLDAMAPAAAVSPLPVKPLGGSLAPAQNKRIQISERRF